MVQGTAVSYAMQQVKNEQVLKSISRPLSDLWTRSIEVASICRLLARRTRMNADEAFLVGLLHGIGKLYIMVRAAMRPQGVGVDHSWLELVAGWHASIGKAVLQSWGFPEEVCDAIGDQDDLDRRWKHAATLADILIAGVVLADALHMPEPRAIGKEGINSFLSIGVTPSDCLIILTEAEEQIRLIHEALA
jgi:HD-like signal output (HDOD) protein